MIRWIRLQGPPGSAFRVQDSFPYPHELPLTVAFEAAAAPDSIILWTDSGRGIAGLYHALGRTAWPCAGLSELRAVVLRPGTGSGATGLELVLDDGREGPVLISRPFEEELVEWLESEIPRIEELLGIEVVWMDYGVD
jgi:hypothetical protein